MRKITTTILFSAILAALAQTSWADNKCDALAGDLDNKSEASSYCPANCQGSGGWTGKWMCLADNHCVCECKGACGDDMAPVHVKIGNSEIKYSKKPAAIRY